MATPIFQLIPQGGLFWYLDELDPNQGLDGCATGTEGGLYSTGSGGDFCYEYGVISYVTGNPADDQSHYDQMIDATNNGNYIDAEDYDCEPLPKTANWIMKDNKRPFGEVNLDWDATHPAYHPYPRPKKQCRRSSTKKSSTTPEPTVGKEVVSEPAKKESSEAAMEDTTSSSDSGDDFDDGASTSSSEACVERALNGETFEGEYEYFEPSETSSSGTSSDGSDAEEEVIDSNESSSQNEASETPSAFDALRSSQAVNMVSQYMSSLSPPDASANLTCIGPSRQKPTMIFTPTNEINGVNMSQFLGRLVADDAASGDKIEIDDDAASVDGPYIEMDLALGVLEEKKEHGDIALRSESSDDSSEDGQESEDVDAIARLSNLKAKGKGIKGSKGLIEEL